MIEIEHWIETQLEPVVKNTGLDLIKEEVCAEFNVPLIKFLSSSRRGSLPTARYVYYYLAYKYEVYMTVSEIGDTIGRDHSNASIGISKIEEMINSDYRFKRKILRIRRELNKKYYE